MKSASDSSCQSLLWGLVLERSEEALDPGVAPACVLLGRASGRSVCLTCHLNLGRR